MRKHLILLIFLILSVLTVVYLATDKTIHSRVTALFGPKTEENKSCLTGAEKKIVQGDSLSGLIEPGSTVNVFLGYYKCNEIRRGDIIAYNYSGDRDPIVKVAKGLPGDKFHLQEVNGGWNILINGETARNSQNQPYILGGKSYEMLSLYERDYKGIIPADAYLILGNLAAGSLDSTHFGLAGKNDILGKAELIKNGG